MATQNILNDITPELFTIISEAIDPGLSGDSYIQFNINNVNKWRVGCDDSDSDAFKISSGGSLGTNDTFEIDSAGQSLMPLQPAFLATHTVDQNNVTGFAVTFATVNYTTEIFDQNGDYNGTNTFTAPVTGRYWLTMSLQWGGITAVADSGNIGIVTSNRSHGQQGWQPGVSYISATGNETRSMASLCDMDAGDTAITTSQVQGLASNTVDYPSNATNTWFGGFLVS